MYCITPTDSVESLHCNGSTFLLECRKGTYTPQGFWPGSNIKTIHGQPVPSLTRTP
jgi:hypothetical protein